MCHKDKPCVNAGSCLDGRCLCLSNFTGDLCESMVDPTTSSLIHSDSVSPTVEYISTKGAGATTDNADLTVHTIGGYVESTTDLTANTFNQDDWRVNTNSITHKLITNTHRIDSDVQKKSMTSEILKDHIVITTDQNFNYLAQSEESDYVDRVLALDNNGRAQKSPPVLPLFGLPQAQFQKIVLQSNTTATMPLDSDINEILSISGSTKMMIPGHLHRSLLVANKRRSKDVVSS